MSIGYRIGGQRLAAVMDSTTMMQRDPRLERIYRETRHSVIALALVREIAIKEALGRWVSELEPVLVYNQHMQFVGLTHAGQELGGYPPVSVGIRGGIPV